MRKLALFCGAFAAGIFAAQYWLPLDRLLWMAVICFLLGCGMLIVPTQFRKRALPACMAVALALGYYWLYVRQIQRPMEALADTVCVMEMTLLECPVETEFGTKVTVETNDLPGKLLYYGSGEILGLAPGQTVTAEVYLQSAARIRDADVTAFTSKGVFLLAYQRGEERIGAGSAGAIRWLPAEAASALYRQIDALFPGDSAGFMRAILTGEKTGLSEEAGIHLSEVGLYHILAVSGMHCGFLLSAVLLLGRHRRRLIALTAIPLLTFFALLTGGSPSVVRAVIMLSLLVSAPLFRRESDGITSLALALLLILLGNPFAAASVSLQLSFAAVAGILWLTPRLNEMLLRGKKHRRGYVYIVTGASATMGALVFSAPISAWYFGTLPLISPLSNLLCLWAAGVIFVLGLLATGISFLFWPLGVALSTLPRLLTGYVLLCARLLHEIPYHAVYFDETYLRYWLIFLYFLFGAAWMLRPKSRRKYVLSAGLAAVALCAAIRLGENRYQNDLDILMLDVGQGQSVVLASENVYLLADCGSQNSWYDAADIAAHRLRSMGCQKLDYLLLTHFDTDHISGVTGLLTHMDVGTLLIPAERDEAGLADTVREAAERHGVAVQTVREPVTVRLGRAALTVFPSMGGGQDNERGISLLAAVEEKEFLLTGDMDGAAERKLLDTYSLSAVEVLAAGHHGSASSTSEYLLQRLTPETVCISVGSNSYGHPAEETMRRLAEHGCAAYRTDLQGTIHISINGGDRNGTGEKEKQ